MRYDLTDFEWSVIEPLLPMDRRGPKPRDNRRVLNGIFWVLRAGAPWRDLPERYGPYTTAYNRFNRWRKAGIWDRLMDAVTKAHDGKVQMIDSSIVREHQHASGVKERVEFVVLGEVAPARQGGRARPPGSARRRPASRINRARTAAGRLGERATSKRSSTAVETLLTFCPPGPEAPMNSSLSFDSGDIDDARHAQQSDASAVPRLPPRPESEGFR